ncbi:hypothetical protein [Streptomyces sp. NPDC058614]|uniref:hypothetical protein n=1 Tax=Streptomyces sp. NPDC058614 TaxID=3346557 RepID=UPI003661564B
MLAANAAPDPGPSADRTSANRTVPKHWTCQNGKFHWGKVVKREVLVAVSDAQQFDVPAGKSVKAEFEAVPVRSLESAVTPVLPDDAVLDPQAAVGSLEEETGLDLAKAGTSFVLSEGDKVLKTEFGEFSGVLVGVVSVNAVEASFVYGCTTPGRESVRGTLNTWSPVTYSGLFKCGIDEELSTAEIEAEALLCGEK